MATILQANTRDDLKGSVVRRLRNEGKIPAVVYGKQIQSRPLYVDQIEFIKTYKIAGKNGIISLKTEGENLDVITHDIQREAVKGEIIHIDFLKVDMNSEMDANVPLHLVGEAVGVSDGGIVQQTLYELSVRCLPANIPDAIEVDISSLMIGDSLTVNDIPSNNNYLINHDPEEGIVSVLAPVLNNEPDEQQEKADKEEAQEKAAAEEE